MKRFHIHVGVSDINESVQFYSTLFGQMPTKQKEDYAKWMLEDPKVNFAISTRTNTKGVDHLGIQAEEVSDFTEITERLKKADLKIFDEGETTCCYAKSDKAWVQDPNGLAWEAYLNMEDAEVFSEKPKAEESTCFVPDPKAKTSCC